MNEKYIKTISPVAVIHTDFTDKFGLPRQSGRVKELTGTIDFLPPYRDMSAVKGLGGFSHIWLIWGFSGSPDECSSLTVRPPRLGGNTRVGVFASRSPFRPNGLGMSAVKIESITEVNSSPVITVSGIDMLDGTPIYDIKPYLPMADTVKNASGSYSDGAWDHMLKVDFPEELLLLLPEAIRDAAVNCIADDPRPSYQNDPERLYSMMFASYDIRFTVSGDTAYVKEVAVPKENDKK